jgi:23S rRNA (cytosine1962-C5)-methyltransferase
MNVAQITPPLIAARVILRPRKALPFYGRHPWVLASAIDRVEPIGIHSEHQLDIDGQPVELLNDKRKFIAHGIYNSQSRIAVRLYSWNAEETLDDAFIRRRLEAAIELRRQIGYEPLERSVDPLFIDLGVKPQTVDRTSSATRLVFSEADGLSGLVVDRYGDYLVVQPTSLGMAQRVESIVGILQELLRPRGVILKLDKAMAKLEGFESRSRPPGGTWNHDNVSPLLENVHNENEPTPNAVSTDSVGPTDGHVWGELPEGPITIRENGIAYEVDLRVGQKTGLYLDQRENRVAAAKYLGGRRVLDMFCYTGGFAMAAAKLGGASEVLAVDGSKTAIAQAQKNAQLNGLQSVHFECADGFKFLDELAARGEKFGAVILDPPKFARGRGQANAALMAYHRLNKIAVNLLERGGILLTCSCTGGVSREDFLMMLSGVAQKSGREISFLETRGAAPDHPVSATCLETEYLKCAICVLR